MQVERSPDPYQLTTPTKLSRHHDSIGRFAPPVQVDDDVVDLLVYRPVEVAGLQGFNHVAVEGLADAVLGPDRLAETVRC